MKKALIIIIAFVMALAMFLVFVACSTEASARNVSYGLGCFDYRHIHIFNGVEGHCATVEKWYENEGAGIEVKTAEYGSIFCSEGAFILFSTTDCPFCGGGK